MLANSVSPPTRLRRRHFDRMQHRQRSAAPAGTACRCASGNWPRGEIRIIGLPAASRFDITCATSCRLLSPRCAAMRLDLTEIAPRRRIAARGSATGPETRRCDGREWRARIVPTRSDDSGRDRSIAAIRTPPAGDSRCSIPHPGKPEPALRSMLDGLRLGLAGMEAGFADSWRLYPLGKPSTRSPMMLR